MNTLKSVFAESKAPASAAAPQGAVKSEKAA